MNVRLRHNLDRSRLSRSSTTGHSPVKRLQITASLSRSHDRHLRRVLRARHRANDSHSALLRRKPARRSRSRIHNLLRIRKSKTNHRIIEGLRDFADFEIADWASEISDAFSVAITSFGLCPLDMGLLRAQSVQVSLYVWEENARIEY
jgi:hypothetical protein